MLIDGLASLRLTITLIGGFNESSCLCKADTQYNGRF
jgi:hypothetical protein